MNKYSLKSGMIVELSCGRRYIVSDINGKLTLLSMKDNLMLSSFNNDLEHKKCSSLNIEKVYKLESPRSIKDMLEKGDLIWARRLKLTLPEIEEKLGIDSGALKIDYGVSYGGIDLEPGMIIETTEGDRLYLIHCKDFLGYVDKDMKIKEVDPKFLRIKRIWGPVDKKGNSKLIFEA